MPFRVDKPVSIILTDLLSNVVQGHDLPCKVLAHELESVMDLIISTVMASTK